MDRNQRSGIAIALILILVGVWLLVVQFVPSLQILSINDRSWPLLIVGLAAIVAILALVTWTPPLLIPACILGGLGGLLYYQNATGNWESWAYAWTLIPGLVGIGVFVSSLLQGKVRAAILGGGWLVIISASLFLVFGSFLGGPNLLGPYWPVILILLGVIALAQSFLRFQAR